MLEESTMENVIDFLHRELGIRDIDHLITEENEDILMCDTFLIITFKDNNYIYLNFDLGTYPDTSAMSTLGIQDMVNEVLGGKKEILIGEVFSFDKDFNMHLGDEAVELENNNLDNIIHEKAEQINEMDYILITHEGYEC